MKKVFKTILKYYLKIITKLVLLIHKPKVIAIAGSINKQFTKDEIKRVIEAKGIKARTNPKNFNTEIGLPLSILSLPSGYGSYKKWIPVIKMSFSIIFNRDFPDYLVLELGTSDPGDMKYLLSIIKPHIVIITDITQRYIESFHDIDQLIEEYQVLIKKLPSNGLAILNADNPRIMTFKQVAKCPIMTYGIDNIADWQATELKKIVNGFEINIKHKDSQKIDKIERFGKHHVYSRLVAEIIDYNITLN